jgi:hypothetical protein
MADGAEVANAGVFRRTTSVTAAHQDCAWLEAGGAHKRRPFRTMWLGGVPGLMPYDNVRGLMGNDLAEGRRTSRLDHRTDLEHVARRKTSGERGCEAWVYRNLQSGHARTLPDSCERQKVHSAEFNYSITSKRCHWLV